MNLLIKKTGNFYIIRKYLLFKIINKRFHIKKVYLIININFKSKIWVINIKKNIILKLLKSLIILFDKYKIKKT